jgi:hypothetical protein
MKTPTSWKFTLATAAALASFPTLAKGQGGAPGFGPGGGQSFRMSSDSPNDPSTLLTAEAVQKELALSDEQKAQLKKLRDERTADSQAFFSGFMGLSQSEMQNRLEERAKASRVKIDQILTPKQIERLSEINIQVAGVAALGFADVAEKIGLSADQKAKLKDLADDASRRVTDLMPTSPAQLRDAQARQERQKKLDAIKSERKDKALAILTDEQKSKFENLNGAAFDLKSIKVTNEKFSNRAIIPAPANPNPL